MRTGLPRMNSGSGRLPLFSRTDDATRRRMRAVNTKNSKPELLVADCLRKLGYRFRTHGSGLAGTPDIVFLARRKIIFVHGCFWHGHPGCKRATTPERNRAYWQEKVRVNRARDRRSLRALAKDGWSTHIVWECQIKNKHELSASLSRFLGPARSRTKRRDMSPR